MNKWSFDETYLKNAIKKGNLLLTRKNNRDLTIKGIKDELCFFDRWLNGNFEFPYRDVSKISSIDSDIDLKKEIMHDVKICGSCFGKGYTSLIEMINNADLFSMPKIESEIISVDEQADVVMKTYEAFSPCFLDGAKSIVMAEKPHIQVVNDDDFLSYSYSSTKILNESFVVLNPKEGNGILNYYVQEGIEDLMPLGYSVDYFELGPTLFQLLFHDKLYEEKDIKYSTDYYQTISKFSNKLKDILPVLYLYQATRTSKEKEINDEVFIDLCIRYFGTDNLEVVYNEIRKILKNDDCSFIFSVIYALDIICNMENGVDVFHSLNHLDDDYLYTDRTIKRKFKSYQKYMDRINNCCK